MNKTFGIHFGALCDPISKQLDAQGFKYNKKQVTTFESHADAILKLRFADLLTDSVYDSINKRLFKQIQSHVMKENKLKAAAKTKSPTP